MGIVSKPQPTNLEYMTLLAFAFPSLRNAPGVSPFDPEKLAQWCVGGVSHGQSLAARFVLGVWSGNGAFPGITPFDFFDAMGTWDEPHRRAFNAWCHRPHWP